MSSFFGSEMEALEFGWSCPVLSIGSLRIHNTLALLGRDGIDRKRGA
jgi:hypothetical protein